MRVLKVKVISLPYIFQVLFVLCFARPRYQVSVYRTNGPLVYVSFGEFSRMQDYFKTILVVEWRHFR